MELIKSDASTTSSELAQKGLVLCKAIVPSQETVEGLLFSPRDKVAAADVRTALMNAATPYKELIIYYNELIAVHRHVVGTAQGSKGSRFKPLQA